MMTREGQRQRDEHVRPLDRRHFLRITAVAGGAFIAGQAGKRWLGRSIPQTTTITETRLLMGTLITLSLVADDAKREQGRAAIAATFAEMERLITIFDWRQAGSPLATLNERGVLLHPPAELVDLLRRAALYSRASDGAFDVTVQPMLDAYRAGNEPDASQKAVVDYRRLQIGPKQIKLEPPGGRVTLDGIAKGRVVDGATAVLHAQGFPHIMVEAGGDLVGRGRRADGRPWQVGLNHPRQADLLGVLPVSEQAVATSGDYQHSFTQDRVAHHIIDPRRGISPAELASVTVLAPTATAADALSTAVMALGPDRGLALVDRLPHTAALLVTKEMNVLRSAGFPALA